MVSLKKIVPVTLIFVLLIITINPVVFANGNDLTIYTIKENYELAKYEPRKGIYLGAYVYQNEWLNQDMNKFNEMTEKTHAAFFRYIGYGQPFPGKWVESVKANGAIPHIAFEPNNGLDQVKDDEYLRNFAKAAKEAEVPIFLRYASEMNGTWTQYSGKAQEYIEKWQIVHDVMEEEAPNVIMVWTVFTFPEWTIQEFYPGDEYVDWVGVNIYNVIYHNNNINNKADNEDPLKLLDYVYNTYSYKKPIQISEYGVTHYTTTDNKYYIDFAKQKLTRLYGNLPSKYPRVKAIFYFDVNNTLNAPAGRKINDYSITNDPELLRTYKELINNKSYLSEVVAETINTFNELLSYRGNVFLNGGKTYADVEFFENYLGLKVEIKTNKAIISNGTTAASFPIVNKKIPKGFYNQYRLVKGVALRDVADKFNYSLRYNDSDRSIYLIKR